jgi:hypothetical protein
MKTQPVPKVTDADVERIVRREFPDRTSQVFAMLEEYGQEPWHREVQRVRVAALKLAAGDFECLRREIERAKCDYRDVLVVAEYPGYSTRVPGLGKIPADEEQRTIDADWKQYQDWFKR